MKIAIVSYTKDLIRKVLPEYFKIDNKKPDLVFCLGGEGSFLFGEQVYPNIPKVLIKHHRNSCKKCKKKQNHNFEKIFRAIKNKKYSIKKLIKLEVRVGNKKLVGMNDINIHYCPPCAMRFSISINGKAFVKEAIGDGVVVSTPYGSSGYYSSITRKTFKNGIGLAFNNPCRQIKNKIIGKNAKIKVKILRGPAIMAADCNKRVIHLKDGDIIAITKAKQEAKILSFRNIIKSER